MFNFKKTLSSDKEIDEDENYKGTNYQNKSYKYIADDIFNQNGGEHQYTQNERKMVLLRW